MSRVLLTGGAGALGAAVLRRLLGDPRFEVRVSDVRPLPHWIREGAAVHTGDLRVAEEARTALAGCRHVIHLAAAEPADAGPFTLLEAAAARSAAAIHAALEEEVARFVYVSSGSVFERAQVFPTPEEHLAECPPPRSPEGFAHLAGERLVRAAGAERGLPFTICRPWDVYGEEADLGATGSAERVLIPTHVDDIAEGILTAMCSPAGLDEDFNLTGPEEVTGAELARSAGARRHPTAAKARRLLGWEARIGVAEGVRRRSERETARDL